MTGASSGIGRAIAREIAARGQDVVLVARRRDRLEDVASELRTSHGVDAHVFAADLGDRETPERIKAFLDANGLTVHTLVNNAGYGLVGDFRLVDRQDQLGMIQVNLTALTDLTHRLLPKMIERGEGIVLNVASTAAFQPAPLMAVYHATKAYVLFLTEALAEELRGTGVTATALCPGPVKTEFGARIGVEGKIPALELVQLSADKVAKIGLAGAVRGKTIVVPGFLNGVGAILGPRLPRALVRKIIHFLQRTRA